MTDSEKKAYVEKIRKQLSICPKFLYPRNDNTINLEMNIDGKYSVSCSFPSIFQDISFQTDKNFIEKCVANLNKYIKEHKFGQKTDDVKKDFD